MNILFVFCEGPHDAQFIGRLLQESNLYTAYQKKLKDYPTPLSAFISNKFRLHNIDEIRIGKQKPPMVPICSFKKNDEDLLVLPISLGGMDKYESAKDLISQIKDNFAPDILERTENSVEGFSIMFIYDADSRGIDETVALFKERYNECFEDIATIINSQWAGEDSNKYSLFVFTGHDNNTGTLEDYIIELFRNNNAELINEATKFIDDRYEELQEGGDEVAYQSKRKKSILTTCGQIEKSNSGSALTVVLRDTNLLRGAFNFQNEDSKHKKLLNLINTAFN